MDATEARSLAIVAVTAAARRGPKAHGSRGHAPFTGTTSVFTGTTSVYHVGSDPWRATDRPLLSAPHGQDSNCQIGTWAAGGPVGHGVWARRDEKGMTR